jgi:hypothetical protein
MRSESTLSNSELQEEKGHSCIVCGQMLPRSLENDPQFYCQLCTTLGDVSIKLEIVECEQRQSQRVLKEAYFRTSTGIVVVMIRRNNGLVRFEFDLWRTNWDIRKAVLERLRKEWDTELSQNRGKFGKRDICCGIGKSHMRLDVLPEYADRWKALVHALLSTNAALEWIA